MTPITRLRLSLYGRLVNSCTRVANRSLLISGWALQKQLEILKGMTK